MKDIITQAKVSVPEPITLATPQDIELHNDELYKDHLYQTFMSLSMIRNLPPPEFSEVAVKMRDLPSKKGTKKTVIFDLDETLVHCYEDLTGQAEVVLPVHMPTGEVINIAINVRPFARECLKAASKSFEVIMFTASQQCYADTVLDFLDPNNQWIDHRLYRQDCIEMSGMYIKDLRILNNRKLDDIVIVDNAIYSFCQQLNNGIPIISWVDNIYDRELYNLIDYLRILKEAKDIREINRKTFRLETFYEDYISQYLSVE